MALSPYVSAPFYLPPYNILYLLCALLCRVSDQGATNVFLSFRRMQQGNSVSDNLGRINKLYQTLKCLVLLHFVCLQNTKYNRATCFNSNQIQSFIIHAVLRRSVLRVCGDHLRVIARAEATQHLSKKYCCDGQALATLCSIRLT